MKSYHPFTYVMAFFLLFLFACAPKAAYEAKTSLHEASQEASCQAEKTRGSGKALKSDLYKMQGDTARIKEAEGLFDKKTGIVLSY